MNTDRDELDGYVTNIFRKFRLSLQQHDHHCAHFLSRDRIDIRLTVSVDG